MLATAVHELGEIHSEQGRAGCISLFQEAVELYRRIGDPQGEVGVAFGLGTAYKYVPKLRDLDQAERWYQRSLALRDESDKLGRARSIGQLGFVARERFKEARAAWASEEILVAHLDAALGFYQQALELIPPDALHDVAITHNQLGVIYGEVGMLEPALEHYRESVRYQEATGDQFEAGQTRFNAALDLARAGRYPDAFAWATAALRDYQPYGERAAADIAKTERLIADIEQDLAEGG
jgi:tetratricopeptide (TPR) repeat protein